MLFINADLVLCFEEVMYNSMYSLCSTLWTGLHVTQSRSFQHSGGVGDLILHQGNLKSVASCVVIYSILIGEDMVLLSRLWFPKRLPWTKVSVQVDFVQKGCRESKKCLAANVLGNTNMPFALMKQGELFSTENTALLVMSTSFPLLLGEWHF
jgi:hypothetical protein